MIDYKLLDNSIKFYEAYQFQRIESPWTVSEEVDKITKPSDRISFQLKHNNKCLVASGEQSFLYLYLKNFLPKGQYQTITPCFRLEAFDFLHTKYFIKNELIKTDEVNQETLERIVNIAFEFYQPLFKDKLDVVKTSQGYDIEINGKELGSYGIRSCEFLDWIYGTGCAEPRTSSLIKLYEKNGLV
jgi:seryl-tRNA synthetase